MSGNSSPDFGTQLGKIVQEAIQSGDFTRLKKAVDVTAQEIKKSVRENSKGWSQPPHSYTPPRPRPQKPIYTTARPVTPPGQSVPPTQTVSPPIRYPASYMPAVKQKIPGNASSILFLTFGMIGLIPSAIVSVVFLCLFLAGAVFQSIPFLLTGIFSAMTALGAHIRRRVKRFRRYQRVLYGSRYYSMEHLAAATGESRKFVVRDVRKMIRKGMFSDAYLDDKATCLMLDRETYSQYLQTRQNLEQRRMEEKQAEASPKPAGDPKPKDAAAAAVEEGREYIRKIKAANDAIPDQEISQKLFRLEEITGKVFAYVEQHPNKISEIRKFMNYYLPTTLKLVNAYCEFDRQPVEGQNIAGTKQEIRDILDTINTAFENLLDGLFADDAMDISTDISALEIMLAQDGLTGRDFKVEK